MNPRFSLVTELERLAKALSSDGAASTKLSLQSVAERIAKSLGVKSDEVAIMGLSTRWKHLYFLAPEALQQVGYIPLSSNSALAARTARESRPEINNKFAAVRHASVFEGVKVGNSAARSHSENYQCANFVGWESRRNYPGQPQGHQSRNRGSGFHAE